MNTLTTWFIAYALPALATGSITKWIPFIASSVTRGALVMHVGLALSILISHYALTIRGVAFPWIPTLLPLASYVGSVLIAWGLLGPLGAAYGISALLQQLTMLLTARLLLAASVPLWLVVLLIVPVFVWCHALDAPHQLVRISLIALWGVLSIVAFSRFENVYAIAALHTLLGAILIRYGVLYATS